MNITIKGSDVAAQSGVNGSGVWELLSAIGPTLLWVLLVGWVLWFFERPIRALISKTTGGEAFGVKFYAQQTDVLGGFDKIIEGFGPGDFSLDGHYPRPRKDVEVNVYFFSHDLTLTLAGLLSGAKPRNIKFTLDSALNHIGPIGLGGTKVDELLRSISVQLGQCKEELTPEEQAKFSGAIWKTARFVGTYYQGAAAVTPR